MAFPNVFHSSCRVVIVSEFFFYFIFSFLHTHQGDGGKNDGKTQTFPAISWQAQTTHSQIKFYLFRSFSTCHDDKHERQERGKTFSISHQNSIAFDCTENNSILLLFISNFLEDFFRRLTIALLIHLKMRKKSWSLKDTGNKSSGRTQQKTLSVVLRWRNHYENEINILSTSAETFFIN